jgi:hypothetical protein
MAFPLALPVRYREHGKRNWERCLGVAYDPLGAAANSRSRLRPRQGASVPPCSPPSRCGLAKSEFAARLARRPTLTASARGGELSARSGRRNGFRIEQRNGPKQSLCRLFVITIRKGAPRVSCSIIPAGPSSPHRLACSGLTHPPGGLCGRERPAILRNGQGSPAGMHRFRRDPAVSRGARQTRNFQPLRRRNCGLCPGANPIRGKRATLSDRRKDRHSGDTLRLMPERRTGSDASSCVST